MQMSLRELIAKANDRKVEPIDVPEWPGTVGQLFVRSISAREQMECVKRFGPDSGVEKKPDEYWPALVAYFLCDTEGVRIFADEESGEMADRNVDVLMRIAKTGMKFNGMAVDENAAKNSEPTPA